ncbi:Uncaracterized surface protein containing fasciclin (FAS1) repeats [Robiginitalea myxolifaciens]|uniref:Uncaracterized surface protein containing fasciclin (FAS1) repeats n=2 Tax=Robiginitalea myxolifaciens TaxID=400055 RepID=A0A1I6GTG8_9FLAO|nr:Uncaracterized surface protein containing fasciclin (FAS1) repeats [Robiginitalea myxolifaciens]
MAQAAVMARSDAQSNSKVDSLSTALKVLELSELREILSNSGQFTVFAPSDAAFKQLGEEEIKALLQPENKQELRSLMAYHIVAGKLTASRILQALSRGKGYASLTTIQGEELRVRLIGTDIVLMDCSGNEARITAADTTSRNLVFHRIDRVVVPAP